jgi:uncharacterized integral membrane protein
MRFVYLVILMLAVAALAVFAIQNNETVTLQYFNWSDTCTLPLLIAVVYLLGMVIGLLRHSLRRVTDHPQN